MTSRDPEQDGENAQPCSDEIYRGSDGRYYGSADLWNHFESGAWKPCWWDTDSMEEWVETQHGELLVLVPVTHDSLPRQVRTERVTAGISVSHTDMGPE